MLERTLALAVAAALALALGACAAARRSEAPTALPADFVGAQVAPFDLVCKSEEPSPDALVFVVGRAEDGSAVVTTLNGQELPDYVTHTYMNAYMWTNGKVGYTVDRMTGVLKTKPGGRFYKCERKGIQLF